MGKSPVIGAAFGIFCIWWSASLVSYLVTGKVWTGGGWIESSARAWIGLFAGAVVGAGVMATLVMVARQWKLASMAGDDVRGVQCSIGQLPMHVVLPEMAAAFPDKRKLVFPPKAHDPEGKLNIDWMDEWFAKYERDFPDHAKLMRAVARMLNKTPDLPAAAEKNYKGDPRSRYGDDRHEHGNLTLLAHSWLGGSVGIWKSVNGFSYTGLQNALEENQNIDLNDKNYKFDPFDPLIGLICFAHDIGKLETFAYEGKEEGGKKKYVQTRPRSDTVGASLIAKMDEFWKLPYDDRMIITLTVGNYRKPSNMPLRRDINNPNKAKALSDRTMAMLKLITEVDDEVGAIEKNEKVQSSTLDPRQQAQTTYDEDLWECFKALLNESFRIHPENHKFRVGQKNTLPTGIVVTLKEDVLRAELSNKIGIRRRNNEEDPKLEGAAFTQALLAILDAKGCLITKVAGVSVDAKSAIWKVDFHGKDKAKSGEAISTWPYAIMINPEAHFPRMSNDQDASSSPNVVGPANISRMADPKVPRPAGPVDALVQGPLEDENGIPQIPEGTRPQKRGGKGQGPQQDQRTGGAGSARPGNQVRDGVGRSTQVPAQQRPLLEPPRLQEEEEEAGKEGTTEEVSSGRDVKVERNVAPLEEESSSGSFLNEVDPRDDGDGEKDGAKRATRTVEAEVFVEPHLADGVAEQEVAVEPGTVLPPDRDEREAMLDATTAAPEIQRDALQTAREGGAKADLLEGLRDKLRKGALGSASTPKTEGVQATNAKGGVQGGWQVVLGGELAEAAQALPPEVIALTRELGKRLEWLEHMRRQQKIAPETLEDGRVAYSFDAIRANDANMDWLNQDMLKRLVLAKRCGTSAPVCFMRTSSGVSLIVVNNAMARQVNQQG